MTAATLVVVELGLLTYWARQQTKRAAKAAWIGAALTIALPAMSQLVVTPTEQVITQLQTMAAAVQHGNMQTIAAGLADDFHAGAADREKFLLQVQEALRAHRVMEAGVSQVNVEWLTPQNAAVTFTGTARLAGTDLPIEHVRVWFTAQMRRNSTGAVLTSLAVRPNALSPVRDLRSMGVGE